MTARVNKYKESLTKRISKVKKEDYKWMIKDLNKKIKDNGLKKREIRKSYKDVYLEPSDDLYKNLLNHKLITGVVVDEDELRISTSPLKNNTNGILGRYEINIYSNSRSYKLFNLDYNSRGYNHYNVDAGGDPCLGDVYYVIDNYENAANLRLVVDTLLHFLMNSYTIDDNYISKANWSKHRKKIT